jgi:hypothetical protein
MSQSNVLRSHLEGEVTRLHGERKMGVIVGVLLVVIVIAYMSWLDRQVAYWAQPQNLVMAASGIIESNLPEMKKSMAALVRKQAPEVARDIGQQVSREVPKLVRNMIEKTIDQYTGKLTKFAIDKYGEAFEAILKGAHGDIKRAVAEDADQERVLLLVKAIEKQFQEAQRDVNGGKLGEDPIFQKLEESHRALQMLNKRLKMMAQQKDHSADRRSDLNKRFIGSFWRYIQQNRPDVNVDDKDALPSKKGKK